MISPRSPDTERYAEYQAAQARAWEARCTRCGACCGIAEGDPCEHLAVSPEGKYACRIYENRFGLHKTLSGRVFRCVPIRDILHQSWPGDECCGYKKKSPL
ncbi:MAG: hypothetical protein A2787_05180 [Omnitrophica WOR_2 bacterium RIFCSPHIGHO2_01_FULL_48_9]|nr:MAG: hypothetical protein A3D10_08980 [Omnitrophica WOR_2 bacterium RIFCSPHIGHO2_02_FULL_48_11]OGX34005.1 MAG: hypothetical protein A2787_05180 [Omnitrophica WOR_2 bacterium RIFCSPHIGHO2_01_FULL_48_9]